MMLVAVLGYGLDASFLGFGKGQATDSFSVPTETLIPLVYAVLISFGARACVLYALFTYIYNRSFRNHARMRFTYIFGARITDYM